MPANVETMMYVRETPWHGLGTRVEEAPNSAEALRLAGLDWTVEGKPIYDMYGNVINGFKANTRSSDNSVLGIVTNRYRVLQNVDAFQFTDNLIGGDVKYETAGSLNNGKRIWLLAKLPSTKIIDDEVIPYVCFTNSFDGTGAIKAIVTGIRVVCQNTLSLSLSSAKRSWSIRHQGDIEGKIAEARETLELTEIYMDELAKQADRWANVTINEEAIQNALNKLFPVKEDDTERKKRNVQDAKDQFMVCYFAPDIAKFQNTAWGFINAASDYVTHSVPKRMTDKYAENRWGKIMDGTTLLDTAVSMFATAV